MAKNAESPEVDEAITFTELRDFFTEMNILAEQAYLQILMSPQEAEEIFFRLQEDYCRLQIF